MAVTDERLRVMAGDRGNEARLGVRDNGRDSIG